MNNVIATNTRNKTPSRWMYLLLSCWVIYYIAKAQYTGITHDEAGTWLNVCKHNFLDFFTKMETWENANNHLLNTLCIQGLTKILPVTHFVLRIPNIAAGILYGIVVIQLAKRFHLIGWQAILFFIALHTSPVVIDFFCLARGYGLCVAFAITSFYYAICFLQTNKLSYLLAVIISSFLMIAANFIGIQFLVANCILLGLFTCWQVIQQQNYLYATKVISILFIGSICCVLPYVQILDTLNQKGEFLYGTSNLLNTYTSFCNDIIYNNSYQKYSYLLHILFIGYGVLILIVTIMHVKQKLFSNKFIYAIYFPVVMLLIMVLLHVVLGAQYPEGRKAILYIPMICISVFFVVIQIIANCSIPIKNIISVTACALLLSYSLVTSKPNINREWWYDVDTETVANYIAKQSTKQHQLASSWYFMPALEFYRTTKYSANIAPLLYNKNIDTVKTFDYYYLYESDTAGMIGKYSATNLVSGGRVLLQKK